MNTFLSSIIAMVGLGIFFATVLAVANKKLKVEEDPNVEKIERFLPSLNCGACGFPSCRIAAEAVIKGEAPPAVCPVGGEAVGRLIAGLLGVEVGKLTKRIAIVHCGANEFQRKKKARYSGIETCRAADMIFWGGMECKFGCLGFGDCAVACPFDAIKMVDGLAIVDPKKCTACGRCVTACPRDIIKLESFEKGEITFVACNSTDKAPFVKRICPVGCIGCGVCEKLSDGVFKVEDNLAKVYYGKVTGKIDWNGIIEKCPMHTIGEIKN